MAKTEKSGLSFLVTAGDYPVSVFSRLFSLFFLCAIFLLQSACASQDCDTDNPYDYIPLKASTICQHHLIVVAKDGNKVRARGFTGAVQAGATVKLQANQKQAETTTTTNGRFELTLALTPEELVNTHTANLIISTATEILETPYRIRQIDDALAKIPEHHLQTGSAANSMVIAYHQNRPFGVIAASMAGELHIFPLDRKSANGFLNETKTLYFLPDETNAPANPYSVALSEDGRRVAVSLQGQHKVALVDIFEQKILNYGEATNAKHPEGLAFIRNNLLVAFTNLIESGTRDKQARYGKGMLVRFIQKDSKLAWAETIELPCQNPTHVLQDAQGQAWVTCSGVFSFLPSKKITLTSPAAFLKIYIPGMLEVSGMKIERQIDLGLQFSPGPAVLSGDTIVAGNTIGSNILLISTRSQNIAEGQLLPTEKEESPSFFPYAMAGFGNLIFITDFHRDRLLVLDGETLQLNSWPFINGLPLSNSNHSDFFKGPIVIVQREGRPGIDFLGPNMFALHNLSAQLVPLSFLQLMGP